MKIRRLCLWLVICMMAVPSMLSLTSCGSTRAYWGVDSEYEYADGYFRAPPHGHKHHHKKHMKHKKHYKKHHKHYKKHHKHD